MLECIKHGILKNYRYHRFLKILKAATPVLGYVVLPAKFTTGKWYGIVPERNQLAVSQWLA